MSKLSDTKIGHSGNLIIAPEPKSQDTPEAVERLADKLDRLQMNVPIVDGPARMITVTISSCEPLVTAQGALRAYARLLRQVAEVQDYCAYRKAASGIAREILRLLDGEPGAQQP